MTQSRLLRVLLGVIIGLVLAAALAWWTVERQLASGGFTGLDGTSHMMGQAAVGGPFTLVDHSGQPVTEATYDGKWKLIFFGFTFCPDVCPTELQVMAQALDLLGEDAGRVQPLFITIDPARDRPETMGDYVNQFHPAIVGLTGSPEQIRQVASAYKVYYAKAPGTETDPESYLMDHSAFIYLMGPKGEFIQVFGRGTPPETLATAVRQRITATS